MWDMEKENNVTALKRFIYSRGSFGTPFLLVPAILFPEGGKEINFQPLQKENLPMTESRKTLFCSLRVHNRCN